MRAWVLEVAGGPAALKQRDWPEPTPVAGEVLIRIRAFGLNRSEMYTRQGHSADVVQLPRVLGIECVGEVIAAPDTDLQPGQTVAALMGGMGRSFDGSYAEKTRVPRSQVIPLTTHLAWEDLAALPETYSTAWLTVFDELEPRATDTVLIRGGTSSVGMAAAAILRDHGCRVYATTRSEAKAVGLRPYVDGVVIDRGSIADEVLERVPGGVDAVIELVGRVDTIADSARALRPGGHLCHVGLLGNEWGRELELPDAVSYSFGNSESIEASTWTSRLQTIVERCEQGRYGTNTFLRFDFDELVEAHRMMEESRAAGKLVVVVDG